MPIKYINNFTIFLKVPPDQTYTYVARIVPRYFHTRKHYVLTFPDIPSTAIDTVESPLLGQIKDMATGVLIDYLSQLLKDNQPFPKQKYRQRSDLKKIKQFRCTVTQQNLEQRLREDSTKSLA